MRAHHHYQEVLVSINVKTPAFNGQLHKEAWLAGSSSLCSTWSQMRSLRRVCKKFEAKSAGRSFNRDIDFGVHCHRALNMERMSKPV